jgi:hypothetical protein
MPKRNKMVKFLQEVKPIIEDIKIIGYKNSTKNLIGKMEISIKVENKNDLLDLQVEYLPNVDRQYFKYIDDNRSVIITMYFNNYDEGSTWSQHWKEYPSIESFLTGQA